MEQAVDERETFRFLRGEDPDSRKPGGLAQAGGLIVVFIAGILLGIFILAGYYIWHKLRSRFQLKHRIGLKSTPEAIQLKEIGDNSQGIESDPTQIHMYKSAFNEGAEIGYLISRNAALRNGSEQTSGGKNTKAKQKSKGNAVAPTSLEDVFMGDNEIQLEKNGIAEAVESHGDATNPERRWSRIPPPSQQLQNSSSMADAMTTNEYGNSDIALQANKQRTVSHTERPMPVVSAAFDDRGEEMQNPTIPKGNESFQTGKDRVEENSLDSIAQL